MKGDRKEEILLISLDLFSQRGYEGVSMRDIAGALGMRQSSLYKHFQSKQAILDGLVKRMNEQTRQSKQTLGFPTDDLRSAAEAYGQRSIPAMQSLGERLFRYWTEDRFASAFRRLLILQQYRSPEMSTLFYRYLIRGVLTYHEALFAEMMRSGYFRQGDASLAALEFYGPIFTLMCAFDHEEHPETLVWQMKRHIAEFGARWAKEE